MNKIRLETQLSNQKNFQIVEGDITTESTDAIVNAANAFLQHEGGVARMISLRGGERIQRESDDWVRKYGKVSHAAPAYTSAGKLPCKYVIHAVGPIWGEGDEDRKLAEAIGGSLQVASELHLASLSFPAISTGIFGFPKARAAKIIFSEIERYLNENPASSLRLVRLVLYGESDANIYLDIYQNRKSRS